MAESQKTGIRVETAEAAKNQKTALPYATPMELWRAFRAGTRFVLHYHGRVYEVERMEAREKVVYVQPPMMAVKVYPDGRGAEGTPDIWMEHSGTAQSTGLESVSAS